MNFNRFFVAAAFVTIAVGCAKEQVGGAVDVPADEVNVVVDAPKVIAQFNEPETRTIINADSDATGKLPMLWTPSDEVGVFTSGGNKNVRYQNDERTDNVPNTTFSALASASGEIEYVYYPYSETNNGKTVTALVGSIPGEQVMGQEVVGDYKRGVLLGGTEEGNYRFKFYNIFSLIRFNINASGTALEGKTLDSITLTVTRDGAAVPVVGDFTFSAVDGTYNLGVTSNVLTTTWNMPFGGLLTSYASVFPEIRKGDILNFVIKAGDYEAALSVASAADFAPGAFYNFPLKLASFKNAGFLKVKQIIRGNFTAGTLNVDGLPSIANQGGPGKSGTQNISSKIAVAGWDIVGFSEDFDYHSSLTSALSGYTFGKHRGSVGIAQVFGSVADTDGLCFAVKNSTCSFATETDDMFIPFNEAYGGLSNGANTCIKKGIRHYVVTMKDDGVQFDVIITHMNTYEEGDGKPAQLSQLAQIAEYINTITAVENPRPVIFMGDTNCRYTRHDFGTNFFGKLNSNISYVDPWIEFHRGGVCPTPGTKSLMIRSNYKGDTTNDIVCSDDQRGEVVDKIIYFNVEGAATKIKAENCYNDIENFTKSTENASYKDVTAEDSSGNILTGQEVSYTRCVGYADHFPVVAEFSYESVVDVK